MTKARDLANASTALSAVTATELGYVDGVTSAIQTQIDSKIGSASAINPTIVDAKGDIIAATAADTVARLAVGANGTVLTAASGQATGLEWATPASGAPALAQIATGNVNSGTSLTISSLSSYDTLMLYISGITLTASDPMYLQINSVESSGNYYGVGHIARNDPQIRNRRYTGSNELRLTDDDDCRSTGAANTFILLLTNCKATGFTTWQYTCAFANNGGITCNTFGSGIYTSAAAVSNLKFFPPNGVSFNGSGTYKIYGG